MGAHGSEHSPWQHVPALTPHASFLGTNTDPPRDGQSQLVLLRVWSASPHGGKVLVRARMSISYVTRHSWLGGDCFS